MNLPCEVDTWVRTAPIHYIINQTFTLYLALKLVRNALSKYASQCCILTKREELSLRTVLALPNASSTGLVCTTWSSSVPYTIATYTNYYSLLKVYNFKLIAKDNKVYYALSRWLVNKKEIYKQTKMKYTEQLSRMRVNRGCVQSRISVGWAL